MVKPDQQHVLELQEDEAEHLAELSDHTEASANVALANVAAIIALNGIMAIDQEKLPSLNEPANLISLLLARAAHHVRFACMGMSTGYYSGVALALRSGLESLALAGLFESSPEEIAIWLRNGLSRNSKPEDQQEQIARAKRALFEAEANREAAEAIAEGVREFEEDDIAQLHVSLQGLGKQFGVDPTLMIPDDFEPVLEEAQGDLDKALDLYVRSKRDSKETELVKPSVETHEMHYIKLYPHFDADIAEGLAPIAFYLGHRVLDSTEMWFPIKDREFRRHYKRWHKEVRRAFDQEPTTDQKRSVARLEDRTPRGRQVSNSPKRTSPSSPTSTLPAHSPRTPGPSRTRRLG